MTAGKPAFSPLPLRAISDKRLAGLHLRALAVIAYHDRLSRHRKNGRDGAGCYASHVSLARDIGVNYTNLSSAITDLGRWGYVTRERHALNPRLHVLRVVYDPLPNGKDTPLPNGKTTFAKKPSDLCPPNGQAPDSVEEPPVNIFPKGGEIDFVETSERNSVETASPGKSEEAVPNVGAQLAALERRLKSRKKIPPHEVDTWLDWLQGVIDEHDVGDPIRGWAERLHCDVGFDA